MDKYKESMIDIIDERILSVLNEDARMSFAELGRKINLSPSSVRERVQKMEDLGIIQQYQLKINHKKLSLDLEAFILLKVFPGRLKHVLEIIPNYKEITEAHRITGSQNLHLKVILKDQICLQKLLDQLMEYGDTNTFLILSEI